MRAALERLRRTSGLPVVFGGLMGEAGAGRFRIGELSGAVTGALRGLAISSGSGLGGKAAALGRPVAVTDYCSSRAISHEYDSAVAAEGLRSVLAVPVVVRRRVRGVLYGALRQPLALGDRPLTAAVAAARALERALLAREEAERLPGVERLPAAERLPAVGPDGRAEPHRGAWEEVREAHGELRALAARVVDPVLRGDLLAVCGRLAAAAVPGAAPDGTAGERVRLAPREVDVLAWVATGATNAVAAHRLGLRPETVKGYLRSAMRKLGARTRLEAVVAARRAGALP
ncbi:helix-turn-helix domain-containing protein [Streptomyces sp. URMC 123]|uniref:helix-turn-helix domain-containing protein n=1 Tax=Streptomyces sp. URMC 123 TaxID=3423403 RepID=UPI003F1AF6D0